MKYKLILFTTKKSILITSLALLSLTALFEVFDHHHSDRVTFLDSRLQLIKDAITDQHNYRNGYCYLAVLITVFLLLLIGLIFNNYYCGLAVSLSCLETTRQSIFNAYDPIYREAYFVKYLYWYIGVMTFMSVIAVWLTFDLYVMRKATLENKVIKAFLDKVQVAFMNTKHVHLDY